MAPLVAPGVVVVWSGGRPCLAPTRIVGSLEVGSQLHPGDSKLLPDHFLIEVVRDRLEISPRDRIELNGRPLTMPELLDDKKLPAYVAAGDTVFAVVDDVRQFEGVSVVRDGGLIAGSTLGPILRAVDEAANAEEHVSLKGPDPVTRGLAIRYADKLGSHAWFRPGGDQHLDHFLSTRRSVRTVILELSRPLFEHDVRAIGILLETDLRFVVVRHDDHYIGFLPPQLATSTLEITRPGPDELAVIIAQCAGPDRRPYARMIAALLDQSERIAEEAWRRLVERTLAIDDDDVERDVILRLQT